MQNFPMTGEEGDVIQQDIFPLCLPFHCHRGKKDDDADAVFYRKKEGNGEKREKIEWRMGREWMTHTGSGCQF